MWGMASSFLKFGSATWRRETLRGASVPQLRRSSIDFPEHDIERSDDGGNVGQHVAARQKVHRRKMREGGRADLASVGLVGAVGDEVDAEFAFGRFDGGIDFAGRHAMPFGIELEVLDDRFHRTFHFGPSWR